MGKQCKIGVIKCTATPQGFIILNFFFLYIRTQEVSWIIFHVKFFKIGSRKLKKRWHTLFIDKPCRKEFPVTVGRKALHLRVAIGLRIISCSE